jgi:hypothetical protein
MNAHKRKVKKQIPDWDPEVIAEQNLKEQRDVALKKSKELEDMKEAEKDM